jgi:poly(3-hydroxybutyrate) depolymerase
VSLAQNVEFFRRLSKLSEINGLGLDFGRQAQAKERSPLAEMTDFGTNPGDLRMFSFVPEHLQPKPALVVVLHGCGQTAAGYDMGAGWSTLAERFGFALLMPEQRSTGSIRKIPRAGTAKPARSGR